MSTNEEVPIVAKAASPPIPTLTVTFYQQLAEQFIQKLDELAAQIPQFENGHASTASFVTAHIGIPLKFLSTTVAAVEQTAELQGINRLDVDRARDTLQFIDAFAAVVNKVRAFGDGLDFTIKSRRATLAADALQVYGVAKIVARDPASAAIALHADNMKVALARKGSKQPKTKVPGTAPVATLTT